MARQDTTHGTWHTYRDISLKSVEAITISAGYGDRRLFIAMNTADMAREKRLRVGMLCTKSRATCVAATVATCVVTTCGGVCCGLGNGAPCDRIACYILEARRALHRRALCLDCLANP